MAFYAYAGDTRYYDGLFLIATNGGVADFGVNSPPADGRWTVNAGPATITPINSAQVGPAPVPVPQLKGRWTPATVYAAGDITVNPSGDLVTAIAAHTSGANYTAANWATSGTYARLRYFDVTLAPYAADPTGATDCTAAVQTAINAAIAAGGGTVFFPRGTYLFSAAQTTGTASGIGGLTTTYSGQVLFPRRLLSVGEVTVRLLGETPAPMALWPPQGDAVSVPVEGGGSILRTTATSGNLFDAIPVDDVTSSIGGAFTNLSVVVDSLTVRCPNNPQVGGLNLSRVLSATVRNTTVGVNAPSGSVTFPPSGSAEGIALPRINNGAQVSVYRTQVYGFGIGLSHSEHAVLEEFIAYRNSIGIKTHQAYHLANYLRVGLYENDTHIDGPDAVGPAGGQGAPLVGTISVQSSAGQTVVRDASNRLKGRLGFLNVRGGPGIIDTIATSGAALIDLVNLNTLGEAGCVLGTTNYNPASGSALSTSSAAFVDVSTSNLVVNFRAPHAGRVVVTLEAVVALGTTAGDYWWNLRDSNGDIAGTQVYVAYVITNFFVTITRHIMVSGLTPGQSYTWKWGHRSAGNAGIQAGIFAANDARPAFMQVLSS